MPEPTDKPALPLIQLGDVREYCLAHPGVNVALVGPSGSRAVELWNALRVEVQLLDNDLHLDLARGAIRWPNGARAAIWSYRRDGHGNGPIIDAIVLGDPTRLTDEVASDLRAASCTGHLAGANPEGAQRAALRYLGSRTTASVQEWEDALSRVIDVGAGTAEHINALADLTAAGIQPWQLRFLAQSFAIPRVDVTAAPRRKP